MSAALLLVTGLGILAGVLQEIPATGPQEPIALVSPDPNVQDDGRLEEAWFGPTVAFRAGKSVDFLWVKPGLDPEGHGILTKAWEPPALRFPGRNAKDHQKAVELTYFFPIQLRSDLSRALAGKTTLSSSQGDWTLLGRFVDANAGSDVTRLLLPVGPGTASATWDLKIVDTATGELMLAVHHRCLSGTAFTGIQDKLEKWSRKFAQSLKEGRLQ